MSEIDTQPFPRGALIAAAGLIAISLVATTAARLQHLNAPSLPAVATTEAPVRMIDLQFADRPDGSVSILDKASGRQVSSLAPNSNGFVRGVMRGLVRDRKMRHIGAEAPFRLALWPDHRLTLDDTATGRQIDLDAFGDINRDAFSVLLPKQGHTS